MTERKRTILSLSPLGLEEETLQVSGKLLDLVANRPDDDKEYQMARKSALLLLDANVAKFWASPFQIGIDKTIFYGNPIVMSLRSDFISSLLGDLIRNYSTVTGVVSELGTKVTAEQAEPYLLASTSKLSGANLEAFLSIWLYINGTPSETYFLQFQEYRNTFLLGEKVGHIQFITNILAVNLKVWDWIKYFGVHIATHAFNNYLDHLTQTLEQLHAVIEGDEDIKLSVDIIQDLRDLHEQLKVLASNDELKYDQLSGFNLNSLMRLFLGEITYQEYSQQVYPLENTHLWGYPNKRETERIAEEEKKNQLQLESEMKDNRSAWESAGPSPYPQNYELFWPSFYPNTDWKENVARWNLEGEPYPSATNTIPTGGNNAGRQIAWEPYVGYPSDVLMEERKKRGILSLTPQQTVDTGLNTADFGRALVMDYGALYPSIVTSSFNS